MHHPVSSTGEIVNELANIRCDDAGLRELALFAGAGGGILGGHLLGWRTVCAVEWEPYAACVLAARQNDGILPAFPIWDDVQTFDGKPWAGRVDVVSGGFPCQDISAAGRGAGIEGKRSGMWFHMARIIGEVRPRYVYVENSPMLTSRGLHRVLGDLAEMGFDARWGVISAADVGAPHQRDRIWIVSRYIPPPPRIWPTPTAHMSKETNAPSEHNRNTPTLTAQVNWATPTVCGNYNRKGASKTSGDGLATQVGGKLNPTWVEWLMGWPLGWTDLKPLEMDRFQQWQQQHGIY